MDITKNEILSYVKEHDIFEMQSILDVVKTDMDKKYLAMHPFSIWSSNHNGKIKWYTYFNDENGQRKQMMRSTKKKLEQEIVDYYKRKEQTPPSIKSVFEEWISEKNEYHEITKQSNDRYRNDFKRFFINNPFAKEIMKTPIKYIDDDILERFIKKTIAELQLTRKAYSGMKTLILGIFKYAKKKKYTDFSISNFIGDLSLSNRVFVINKKDKESLIYNDLEIEIIVDYLKSHKSDIRCLGILLQFQSGLRVGELCSLKYSDLKGRMLHIQRTEIHYKDENGHNKYDIQEHPKSTAGNRYVVLPDTAIDTINAIKKLNPFGEYMLMENGNIIKGSGIRRKLVRICKELDISYKANHSIRRSYATTLIDSGVSDSNVMLQLGHEDISTSRKYYYFSKSVESQRINEILEAVNI
ncbi:MAG: site-specific integrase [Lachnospiraceae bacterium]|nr:site-specific integrase [Lachnospiraceae bacterium]